MSKDCCKECGRESVLDGKVRCVDPGCPCHGHAENEHKEEWEAEFEEFARKWWKSQNGVCACLGDCEKCGFHRCHGCLCSFKDFIRRREAKVREEVLQEVEKEIDNEPFGVDVLADRVHISELLARLRSQGTDTTTH